MLPPAGVVLLHSTRAARAFAPLVEEHSRYDLVAISALVLAGTGRGWRSGVAAASPSDAAMLAMAAPLCNSDQHGVATRS